MVHTVFQVDSEILFFFGSTFFGRKDTQRDGVESSFILSPDGLGQALGLSVA